MKKIELNGWLLEVAKPWYAAHNSASCNHRAWLSNRIRVIVGFGVSLTSEADAVRRALIDAAGHWAKDCDTINLFEREYFGPTGMLATAANEGSGQ